MPTSVKAEDQRITAWADGREFVLHRRCDLESLWDELVASQAALEDERIPYWTELWPAAIALADWLCLQKGLVAGAKCLDIGCGLGFLSLLGAHLGARVLGMDYEGEALSFCRKNARANALSPDFALIDWRFPATAPAAFDFVWGADIMYEARFIVPVADFIAGATGRAAWIADPGRGFFADFRAALEARGMRPLPVFRREVALPGVETVHVPVTVWEMRAPNVSPKTGVSPDGP